jgi:hypothetical protein
MPIPKPEIDETKEEFIGRCMANAVMIDEYPDDDQRYAKDLKLLTQYLEFKTTSKVKIHTDENLLKFIVGLIKKG